MALPSQFCWTRFGTEAGEGITQILVRKERERVSNGGIFLWGIGNAVGPSMRQLVALDAQPEAIFSPIRSAPQRNDVSPALVVRWTAGTDMDGRRYELPSASLVTSRFEKAGKRVHHYALVCASTIALALDTEGETLAFGWMRNLATDRPVGPSQVTAVVRQSNGGAPGISYRAALRVKLVYPYFVQLTNPAPLPRELPLDAA
jgi:hypothetical protein